MESCAKTKTLTAVLFVGGLSRRMGADKATLEFEGEPLWVRQLRLLRELKPEALWVSARSRPEWCPAEIEVVVDEPPSRGPLSGLAAALRRIKTSHLLALAIDLPCMTVEPLCRLRALVEPGSGVVPARNSWERRRLGGEFPSFDCDSPAGRRRSQGDLLEPMCAIYPAEALTHAAAVLNRNDDVSLHSFVRTLRRENRMKVCLLSESEENLFRNANTPQDLEACR